MEVLGLDIGGTGIKGAPVDTVSGEMLAPRLRLPTPKPATPQAVGETVAEIAAHFAWKGSIGCGFPAVVQRGRTLSAANVSKKWIDCPAQAVLREATGCPVSLANDADVAGLAEMRFGAGRDQQGTVLVVTLGTGIGTALFVNGRLVPNTEFGHLELDGVEAEKWAAAIVREKEDLSWKKWVARVDAVLVHMHALMWPDLIIIGGGVSKKHDKFLSALTVKTQVVPAEMRNQAGIIGAALWAGEEQVEGEDQQKDRRKPA
ncbi:MAG: ROK family protein [Candidatus Latescibacteria bacterium]|nr:ROK family protein [Candidatus Latescibacterota bacterium]